MKFVYQYRASDNVAHRGEIVAANRDAAFAALKARGIRPSRVEAAPGVLNVLFGCGKRWMLIGFLAVVLAAVLLSLLVEREESAFAAEDRAQIYADPSLLQKHQLKGWGDVFADPGDAWLARHAIPGLTGGDGVRDAFSGTLGVAPVRIFADDSDEVAKMKKFVNGMKLELKAYLEAGGSVADYMALCEERIATERNIAAVAARELETLKRRNEAGKCGDFAGQWEKKNAVLRSFGLATIPFPEGQE